MRGRDIVTTHRRRTLLRRRHLRPRASLEELLRDGALPVPLALRILDDVAGELRALWEERAEAHGDLKPSTVFVLPGGRAILTPPHAPAAPTTGGSRRGDAYWFAVLAVELLTGTRPIERADAASLLRGVAGFPAAARQALLSGLNPRPKRRPLPHQLVAALEAVPPDAWHAPPAPEPDPEPESATDPAPVPESTAPLHHGIARRLGPYVTGVCVLAVPATGLAGASMLGLLPTTSAEGGSGEALVVEAAALTVTPPTTRCPEATVQLATAIATNGASGTLRLVFWLPGGNRLHERTVEVDEGQTAVRAVAGITVSGEVKLRGKASVTVQPGGRRAWAPFRYDCG